MIFQTWLEIKFKLFLEPFPIITINASQIGIPVYGEERNRKDVTQVALKGAAAHCLWTKKKKEREIVLESEKGTGTNQESIKSIKACREKTEAAKQYNKLMFAQGTT